MGAEVFVGRQTELADICSLLGRARHVTLTGPAGAGKSRLALRLAETLERDSPGYVHVLDLSEAPDDLRVLTRMLADAIGARGRPGVPVMASVVNELMSSPGLVVLDGCDRVAGTAGTLVDRLLWSVGGLRVLATGRQRLGFPREQVYPVGALPVADAVDLLLALAGDRLGAADPAELCRRLDNLPLAIELAAAGSGPAAAGLSADPVGLHDAFALSHELCDAAERLVWARMSVFSGSFDAEAAQYVCAADDLTDGQVLDALLALTDRSVLFQEKDGPGIRYRLLGAVRRFGAARLEELGEGRATRDRHRDFFLGLSVRSAEGWRNEPLVWYRRLVPDLDNLCQAVDHCYAAPADRRKGLEIVAHLWFLWVCCGRYTVGDDLLRRGLEAETELGPERLKALWLHAWMSIQRGDLDHAERTLAECEISTGDWDLTAYLSHFRAHMAVARGDVGEAMRLIKEARTRHRSTGDVFPGFLPTYIVVATVLMLAERHEEAVSVLHEGRELCGSCGDYWTRARLDLLLAQAEHLLGNVAAAAASAREALRGARLFDDGISLTEGIETFAVIAENDGDDALATVLLAAAAAGRRAGTLVSRSPLLADMLERSEARLRGRTDEKEYERLIELGHATCLRGAVEYALQGVVEGPGEPEPED
ncbi:hypothetical protein HS041_08010 [Planomonospora sp. ID67723]|uniref:ATP-binding protein n=1 Tax=Planomonospora sp. ID67723 TaxID=2738134 RepID=UPI0018C3CF4E|nr:AAA family ATPase [Planomonospora sp. ID67723]MBG0827706.1 hypothetical protein [Planomonospora sp. ID67723]